MAKGTSNVKSADLPLRGGIWVVLIAVILLAGMVMLARFMDGDRKQITRLDTFAKSSELLPTPPPVSNEEMDPEKE